MAGSWEGVTQMLNVRAGRSWHRIPSEASSELLPCTLSNSILPKFYEDPLGSCGSGSSPLRGRVLNPK